MMPIGPLMIEHRLIERMLKVMSKVLQGMKKESKADPVFIDIFVDFTRTYADRCHHGKEEDILFRDLGRKPLTKEHREIMGELITEHRWGRKTTARLVEANKRYREGDENALSTIMECVEALISFYPKHIEKEDKHFFVPVMTYFDKAEKEGMLHEEYEFDRTLISRKYQEIVQEAERLHGLST
jgi:hemerythrin-like domain-containing protein